MTGRSRRSGRCRRIRRSRRSRRRGAADAAREEELHHFTGTGTNMPVFSLLGFTSSISSLSPPSMEWVILGTLEADEIKKDSSSG